MKKTNVVKILMTTAFFVILSLTCSNKVQASEASVSANNCNVGENFTVTVSIPQDVSGYDIGGVTVTYSDGSTQTAKREVKVNMDLSWPGNYTASFPGKVAGNANISVNGIILSNANYEVVNSVKTLETTVTITDPNPAPVADNTPAPAPAVTLNFSSTNETMYTNRRVNVRQNYGTDSGIIQTLEVGTEVLRTGVSDGNKDGYSWSRISYNGVTGYLITGALTYDAPTAVDNPEAPVEELPDDQEVRELSEDDEAKIAELSEKFGTIPEVGINIMPYFFIGSCVSCITLIIYIRKEIY